MTQEQAAAELGVAVSTWARWERGEITPRADAQARLATMFGVPPDQVTRWLEGEEAQPLPWLSAEVAHLRLSAALECVGELWRWDMDASRRRVLAALPFAPTVLGDWLLAWSYDPPEPTRTRSGGGPAVGLGDVHRIQAAEQAFKQMDDRFGGGLVRPAVVDYLNSHVAPLLDGRYSDQVGAALLSAVASMTRLAGWTAYDVGRHGLAQAHYGQALRLAKAADDPMTAVRVLWAMSQQASDLRHPEAAVRLARAARHAGKQAQACPRARALLLTREAWATALGVEMAEVADHHAINRVRALIGRAEHAYAAARPGDDEPAWLGYYNRAEFTAELGHAWRMIGEYERAERAAERAVNELGARFPRTAQLNMVYRAKAVLGAGELDAALAHARCAVPKARALQSYRSVAVLTDFNAGLEPHAHDRDVQEWRDYLRAELPIA